jgi:tryptophan 2,3-dioxygenase
MSKTGILLPLKLNEYTMEIKDEMAQRLHQLQEKYHAMGQDLQSYLDGLLYADYLTYWDYIHVDTLLSLQNPKTSFPDEEIFIMYHQITELYFKLSLHELKQITQQKHPTVEFITARVHRINNYFENLTRSFEIMVAGMEVEQFLKFRMSLLPASGFQSAQYRMIEIYATPFIELVDKQVKEDYRKKTNPSISEMYEHMYWKKGATELASGKKTLTLQQFEQKYSEQIIQTAEKLKGTTLWDQYLLLNESDQQNADLIKELKQLDLNVNVNWPLSHYKSAVRYLQKDPEDIKATGGTNWQKYLPPRYQIRVFYPSLWKAEELEEWGKGYKNM